jgi:beta-lactamase regulating signal transducer with metallopeptidase domain
MKSDGPLILAVLFIAAGLTVIFAYGTGMEAFNAAYPLSGANLQLSIHTAGPAAVGGLALTAAGALILIWALVCAFVGLFQTQVVYRDRPDRLERAEQKRAEREELLEQKRLDREEKLLDRQERMRASFPKE